MDVIPEPSRLRSRVTVGAVVVIVLVALGCAVLVAALGDQGGGSQLVSPQPSPSASAFSGGTIFVHVLGEVKRPGLYQLGSGDRAVDAVAAAGGFTDAADQAQLNLARFVNDGEQIIVPPIGATPPAAAGVAGGKVNLNSADVATLDTLPLIGPALAARIVDWRESNGPFGSIEDLTNVSGIGDKVFDGLKDLVTV